MNNKIIVSILSLVLFATLSVFASDMGFTKALKNCSAYSDSGQVQTSGMNVKSNKKIIGWQGDRCAYKETVSFMNINSEISCKFTKAQINEIVSVMDAYDLVQKYSGSSPDLSNIEEAQKTPVSKVWSKYLQDSTVCTITTSQDE